LSSLRNQFFQNDALPHALLGKTGSKVCGTRKIKIDNGREQLFTALDFTLAFNESPSVSVFKNGKCSRQGVENSWVRAMVDNNVLRVE
jgi:hypothetical protein